MKNKKWLILPLLAIIVFGFIYYFYYSTDENNFTSSEKKWMNEHKTTLIDFNVVYDYPVFGEDGVLKTFIQDFTNATNIEISSVTYYREKEVPTNGYVFKVLSTDDTLGENDLLLQEDVYVLFGKDNTLVNSIDELSSKTIGILSSDADAVIYYLKSLKDLKYKTYDNSEELFKAYEDQTVEYIIIPNIMYLDTTLYKENYNIKYVFTELKKKIVLSLSQDENNEKLNTIIRKYFNKWVEDKYVSVYNKNLLTYYIKKGNINDKDYAEFLTKTYTYGYVTNYPYEAKNNGKVEGIAAEYINRMERLANNALIDFKEYDSIGDLKDAIDKGEIDIYFNYFEYENENYQNTMSPFIEKYVVLGKLEDSYVINSFESLKNKNVAILNTSALYNYFKDNSKANLEPYETLSELLKSAKELIVVDKELYSYYKNSKFQNYDVLYENTITNDYNFMIKKDDSNQVFFKVFNNIIGSNSYYNYRNNGLYNLNMSALEKSSFEQIYMYALSIILIPIIAISIIYIIINKRRKTKLVKKDERRKYTDMLTSLKNRNYLNLNIKVWNDSKKYPKSVIIVDLNNLKYVNDNYGHEQGDKLIIGAASILINTQLENSEIIRTDGNEFLIYLVGYSEQQITTFTRKLTKEFKNLSYGFGAAIGFSMITDEIKTIDDAINEATLEMRKDKEEYK